MAKKHIFQVPMTDAMAAQVKAVAAERDMPAAQLVRLYITKGMTRVHATNELAAQQMVDRGVVCNGAPLTIEEARKLAPFMTGEFE